ncbi:MAG: DUF3782 domain-containing protein [Thermoprotei archaeon]|jgi:hypothetical protein
MSFTEEFLTRLEKDKKFRLTVAGLIGYKEILERLSEHDKKFEELMMELKRHGDILQEHTKILQEHTRILREHTDILQEHTKKLSEHDRKFEKLDKKISSLEKSIDLLGKRIEVTIGSMGRRWGTDLERTTLEIFRKILEQKGIEPGEVSKFRLKDTDGTYTGMRGKIIDIDILIKDDKLYIIEVKSYAELDHIQTLYEKIKPIEKALNRKVEKVFIVAVNIDEEAYEKAKELGIETITGNIIGRDNSMHKT